MSAKAIHEATGKNLLNKFLNGTCASSKFVTVNESTNFDQIVRDNGWLKTEKLVVKPDQLIKRRGKLGLIGVNLDLPGVQKWISERMSKEIQVRYFIFNFFSLSISRLSYSFHYIF